MRLNVGSGDFPAAGWVNVDPWPGVNPDVVATVLDLPFPDGSADRVYAGHVLEHLDYHIEVPAALVEIRRVLTPDGRAVFVTPDCDRINPADHQLMHDAAHGGHRWPGDQHKWAATEALLLAAVRVVFPSARAVPPERTSVELGGWPIVAHVLWQCAVITC